MSNGDGDSDRLHGCVHCGLVQRVPPIPARHVARCRRCGMVVRRPSPTRGNQLCAAAALGSLICYPLGITLPVIRLEQMGHVHEASIWSGGIALLTGGQIAVGLVVLLCSVVIPLVKVGGLFLLTSHPPSVRRTHQAWLYRAVELAGRWGMIDVLLVAVLVAAVKLGDLVRVQPGPGVIAFTACVVLSLIASASFDPHAIWERDPS